MSSMTTRVSFVMIAAMLALSLGLLVAQDAGAKPAKGVSVSDRVQAQSDLCMVSGGTFESRDYYGSYTNGHQFKYNKTTCTGGKNPQTCTNTKSDTTCTPARLVLPSRFELAGIVVRGDLVATSSDTPLTPLEEPLDAAPVEETTVETASLDEDAATAEPTGEATPEPTVEVVDEAAPIDAVSEPGDDDSLGEEPVVDDGAADTDSNINGVPVSDDESDDSTPFPDGQIT